MSGEINVLSRTQTIVVDPTSSAVSIINAGPVGPPGPAGSNEVWISATAPPNQEVELWYDTSTNQLKVFTTPGSWVAFPYLKTSGGTMFGAINMSSQKITNLPVPLTAAEPVRKQEFDAGLLNRGPVGRWVFPADFGAITTRTTAGRHIRMMRVNLAHQIDRIALEVTTGVAASFGKWCFYNVDTTGLPTTLASSALFDTITVGVKEVAINPPLPAGQYWYGTIPSHDGISMKCAQGGFPSAAFVSASTTCPTPVSWYQGWQQYVFNFANDQLLPDPFPGINANLVNSDGIAACYVRISGAATKPGPEEPLPEPKETDNG